MGYHANAGNGDIHIIYDQEYADTTARDADTDWNGDTANVGKVVRITSGPEYYILDDTTPTWSGIGGSGVGITLYNSDGTIDGVTRTASVINDGTLRIDTYDTDASSYTARGAVISSSSAPGLYRYAGDGAGGVSSVTLLQVTASGINIIDTTNNSGAKYGADYSTNGIANFGDRWIPDVGYIAGNYRLLPGGNIYFVSSLSDLPTPVSNSITFTSAVCLVIENDVDIGANNIVFQSEFAIIGRGYISMLTSSHASGTLVLDDSAATQITTPVISAARIENTAATPIAITIDAGNSDVGVKNVDIIGNVNITAVNILAFDGGSHTGDIVSTNTTYRGAITMQEHEHVGTISFGDSTVGAIKTLNATISATAANLIEAGDGANVATILDSSSLTAAAGYSIFSASSPSTFYGLIKGCDARNNLGTVYKLSPAASISNSGALTPNTTYNDVGFDRSGNMITCSSLTSTIYRWTGFSNTLLGSISAPGLGCYGVSWAGGNLLSADSSLKYVYVHSGFSTTILATLNFSLLGVGNIRGIAWDGSHILIADTSNLLIHVTEGLNATILTTIDLSAHQSTVSGIAWDGANMITSDSAGEIYVWDGISNTLQYSFNSDDVTSVTGGTINGVAFDPSDPRILSILVNDNDTVYKTKDFSTLDRTTPEFLVEKNVGMVDSATRGGAKFSDSTGVTITVSSVNTWYDISDGGTTLFYDPLTYSEKLHISDFAIGQITWDSYAVGSLSIHASVVITRAGSTGDIFYESAVAINGIVQEDSIGQAALPNAGTYGTITTLPIKRIIQPGDTISLKIRNITGTTDPIVTSAKFSVV